MSGNSYVPRSQERCDCVHRHPQHHGWVALDHLCRGYCGQHTFVQGAVPLAATADDAYFVKLSDEDVYLFPNMTIKANSNTAKDLSELGSLKREKKRTASCRQNTRRKKKKGASVSLARGCTSLCIQTLAPRCTRSVCLQCEEPNVQLKFYQRDGTDGLRAL